MIKNNFLIYLVDLICQIYIYGSGVVKVILNFDKVMELLINMF